MQFCFPTSHSEEYLSPGRLSSRSFQYEGVYEGVTKGKNSINHRIKNPVHQAYLGICDGLIRTLSQKQDRLLGRCLHD